jgi:hypothetical protein
MAGDGFVYGATHNAIVCNNIIRNFSFEGIFLSSNAEDIAGAIISNNYIDGSRVNGTTTSKFNLGIRCDKQYSEISNNTIYNASLGILLGVNELYMNTGVTVSNNTIKVSDSETRNGISLFRTTEHSTITNNTIIFPSYNKASIVNNASGIFNAGNYNTIEGNIVKALLKTTSTGPLYGIELNNLSNDTYISNNRFYNLDAGIYRSDLGGATNSLGYNNFVSCTLNYSGLWNTGVNILGCMKVVFTPTAGNVGYYRIASAVGLLQGKIRIVAFFDNKSTDTILDVCSKGYRTSTDIEQVNIIRSSPYNLGVISEVRTSTSGGTVYLDIYISSATDPDEVAITLSETVPGVYLESVPIFNPVVGSYPRITGVTTGLTTSHTLNIVDGIVDPVGSASLAKIYVDSADGDLKIKFSDGTTKLIVTD